MAKMLDFRFVSSVYSVSFVPVPVFHTCTPIFVLFDWLEYVVSDHSPSSRLGCSDLIPTFANVSVYTKVNYSL